MVTPTVTSPVTPTATPKIVPLTEQKEKNHDTGTTGGTHPRKGRTPRQVSPPCRGGWNYRRSYVNTSDTPHRRLHRKAQKPRFQHAHEAFSVLHHARLQHLGYSNNNKNGAQPRALELANLRRAYRLRGNILNRTYSIWDTATTTKMVLSREPSSYLICGEPIDYGGNIINRTHGTHKNLHTRYQIFRYFYQKNIWSCLLWSPVIERGRTRARGLYRGLKESITPSFGGDAISLGGVASASIRKKRREKTRPPACLGGAAITPEKARTKSTRGCIDRVRQSILFSRS